MATRKHIKTEKVKGPGGEDVRILFYDDGAIRVGVMEAGPMHIFEAFIPGKGKDVIIGLQPYSN